MDILSTRFPIPKMGLTDLKAVIIGGCGNGKTSLMNNLCGTNYLTGDALQSQTRNITAAKMAHLAQGKCVIYDTPGTTPDQEVSLHATLLKATLTQRPLNVIFINVIFQTRGIDIIKDM
jgi:GTPase Era involved in 16S rRNA processing